MTRRQASYSKLNTPETVYARGKTAGWLLKVLENKTTIDDNFFKCLQWVIGDLRNALQTVIKKTKITEEDINKARRFSKRHQLDRVFQELYEDRPDLGDIIYDAFKRECITAKKLYSKPMNTYTVALKQIEQTFALNKDCQALCEFFFIREKFAAVNDYFTNTIRAASFENRQLLANMLDLPVSRLQSCKDDLLNSGLLVNHHGYQLNDFMYAFWETNNTNANLNKVFSRQLSGDTLPLECFQVAPDDIAHVKKLLEQDNKAPVHILLYGSPGTGKSSFARSLAKTCGLKAWTVTSRENDDVDDRRASLTACLSVAARHNGAFVLVDEAERLLDTDRSFGRKTKDKAWLNDFLEKPGQRIIWTTNEIRHIDPAVRRRFSFSIHFEEIGVKERSDIWRQIVTKHHVSRHINDEQIHALAQKYPVEASFINDAVSQAKNLYKEKANFLAAVERILRSQTTLKRDGRKQRIKPQAASDFTLDGVCLEDSAAKVLEKCHRIDAAMRENDMMRPGCATMLFYGPPGTGKTALARYIAKKLDRECMVQRASDLFSPWFGMTEQLIAEAFNKAESKGAVLVIDEADTFLYSRNIAQRSWETSHVNEFLTALEECRCFCICTTNRRDNLDAAAMRRFSHKVAFTYAGQEQVKALYSGLLAHICAAPLSARLEKDLLSLDRLTPGDFHAVRSQYDSLFVDASEITHEILVDALAKEQSLKTESRSRLIGFSA